MNNGPIERDIEEAIVKLGHAASHANEAGEPEVAEQLLQATHMARIALEGTVPVAGNGKLACPGCGSTEVHTDEIGNMPGFFPDLYRLVSCPDCDEWTDASWTVIYKPVQITEVQLEEHTAEGPR